MLLYPEMQLFWLRGDLMALLFRTQHRNIYMYVLVYEVLECISDIDKDDFLTSLGQYVSVLFKKELK